MAIINYTDQLKYAGKGYLDAKMMPVKTYDDLKSIPLSQRFEGFTVVVLNDGNPQDYWLVGGVSNSCWTPKTTTNFDELKLVLEDGFLKLMNAEVELGEAVNLNDFFPQGGEDSGNSNDLYIESVDYTDKDADDNLGIFMCFTYSDGTKKYLNMSQFLSQTYAPGNGIVIDGNVISIDSAILGKIEALEDKTAELTSEIANKVTADEVVSIVSEQTEEIFNQIANKAEKSDLEAIGNEIAGVKNIVNEEKVVREEADANLQNELNQIKDDLTIVANDVDSNKKNISTNSVEIAALKERVNALSSNAEGSTPDGKTIGVTDDEQKALYVKVLNKDGNILSVESDNGESGLCAFIPFYCEDEELMEE